MSQRHPVIAITGSSGAGTTTVRNAFDYIFRRENIRAAYVDGDSFLRHERAELSRLIEESNRAGKPISHFGPEANRFDLLEQLFAEYGKTGTGVVHPYVREDNAAEYEQAPGTFAAETPLPDDSDLLLYEGLHGGMAAKTWTRRHMSAPHNPLVRERRSKSDSEQGVDIAQHVDFLLGIVPVVNLEWIQKIHRDAHTKNRAAEETTTTILRRLRDYINFMTPQFSLTDINFQRVPLVDTSNPFIAMDVPTASESLLVVRFREPKRYDLVDLLKKFDDSFMSRPNTLVIPGGKLHMALEVICTPRIQQLVDTARRLRGAQ
ncbi:MAG: phosphoribulokinase [Granulosicoccaceae bacterium]|jgi:phosphoribulokinase